uniref:Ground-like domain-containing protein n=1 Tax=Wuchereria bancrofti TaxID=6293 RepID=A0AAF5PUL8_WUCBA
MQSGIRQSLLEKLNKFSGENSQKLVLFKSNNTSQDDLQIADKNYQRGLISDNQYQTSQIQPNYQTTSIVSEVGNPIEPNLIISQKHAENLENWKKIRERRLRLYKAFRSIQNLNYRRQKYKEDNSAMNANKIVVDNNRTMFLLNDQRKKNSESVIDPINTTFNDWETFIADYGKVMPQYHRRHAVSNEYGATNINSMNNPFTTINESTNNNAFEYTPQIRKMQSSGIAPNSYDYQQFATNLNSAQQMISNRAEAIEHLPPPPNPKSTEASVHTVQVYPPSQQPDYYQENRMYQNNGNEQMFGDRYGGRANFQQPLSQLMSNDYNIDTASYMPEVNPNCINDPCEIDNGNPFGFIEDERCNSPRLKQIILQNIVQRDAEASKQAIYNVCETEMEIPCNVICGTGFYSYLARASNFCLVSMMDISCYAFLPACNFNLNLNQKQWIKRHRTKV